MVNALKTPWQSIAVQLDEIIRIPTIGNGSATLMKRRCLIEVVRDHLSACGIHIYPVLIFLNWAR